MRRNTSVVSVGNVKVGGNNDITVQSMTKTNTSDVNATVKQIKDLEEAGCEIIRCAVPDMAAAEALKSIKQQGSINPGNLRDSEQIKDVVKIAKERSIPIRIGVNFGSLPPVGGIGKTKGFSRHMDMVNTLPKASEITNDTYSVVDHMIATALWEISLLEQMDFDDIKISLKAFDVPTTIESYRRLAKLVPYPFHLGITEAGTAFAGSIRTAVGLGVLLYEGIGDTIRVSLSDDPVKEVEAGFEILKSLNLRNKGTTLVACPSCGRADVDVRKLANDVDQLLKKTDKNIKVAVMGCEVNGPGEAKDADIGIAAGAGRAIIFKKGEKVKVVPEENMLAALMEEIENTPSSV